MNRELASGYYTTSFVEDREQGFAGLELHRDCKGNKDRVARLIFWDACGQFVVETFGKEIPLEIMEDLIAEAKASIRIR